MVLAVDEYLVHDMEQALTIGADNESPIECSPPSAMRPSKILPDSESQKEPLHSRRTHHSSSLHNHRENSVSKRRCSMPDTESNKSSECRSNRSRYSIEGHFHRSHHSVKQSATIIKPVNAYYWVALGYCRYRLSDRSQHYHGQVESRISKRVPRLEVQLKSQIFYGSDLLASLAFSPRFKSPATQTGFMKEQ